MSLSHPKFRLDINGLRAFAVLLVVLYHFELPGFGGGFIGVDLFFVISGYLMTQIIIESLAASRFSLLEFYLARARRIVPALAVLCGVLLVQGWFWLPTLAYQQLISHATAALAFVSNVRFWLESGYFEAASHDKWLLHTWSLSVEWQFYLLLPLGLWLAWRLGGKRLAGILLLLVALASFALSVYASSRYPAVAFYLLPTRAWELLAGAGLWWFKDGLNRLPSAKAREALGFGLLLVSMLVLDSTTPWPSGWALLPVMAAVLILSANRQQSVLTSNRLAQWLGLVSYSVYLWHWPLLVLGRYTGYHAELWWQLSGIGLSLLLGYGSYRLIERPLRGQSALPKGLQLALWLLLPLGLAWSSQYLLTLPVARVSVELDRAYAPSRDSNPRRAECQEPPEKGLLSPGCQYGGDSIAALVWGDSHADAIVTAVQAALPQGTGLKFFGKNGCATLFEVDNPEYQHRRLSCSAFNADVWQRLQAFPPQIPLIIANRMGVYWHGQNEQPDPINQGRPWLSLKAKADEQGLSFEQQLARRYLDSLCQMAQTRPVYLLSSIPEFGVSVPNQLSRAMIFQGSSQDIRLPKAEYLARQQGIRQLQQQAVRQCGVKLLEVEPYFCDSQYCWGSRNGEPWYYDDNHLTETANKQLVPLFKQVFMH